MSSQGNLFVIEGIDGSGKSTICRRLCQEFDCVHLSQPEDSWVGKAARRALKEDVPPLCDLFLHMAAHANQQTRIVDELDSRDVIMDRYYHSRAVYQAIDTHLSPSEIEELHLGWSVEPVITVILDVDPEIAIGRIGDGGDKFEKYDFLSEVRKKYIETFGQRSDVHLVDASMSREDVYQEVVTILYGSG